MKARRIKLDRRQTKQVATLKKLAEQDGAYRVAKRLHAVLLNAVGWTAPRIATLFHVHRANVTLWLRHWQAHGLGGVLEGQRAGRPAGLTIGQRQQLTDILDSGPIAYGFATGVWTSPMIAGVIEAEFGLAYHPGHVRKLLAALGFSVQRPKRQLARANPDLQNRWRRYTYPNLKKNRTARRRADLHR